MSFTSFLAGAAWAAAFNLGNTFFFFLSLNYAFAEFFIFFPWSSPVTHSHFSAELLPSLKSSPGVSITYC